MFKQILNKYVKSLGEEWPLSAACMYGHFSAYFSIDKLIADCLYKTVKFKSAAEMQEYILHWNPGQKIKLDIIQYGILEVTYGTSMTKLYIIPTRTNKMMLERPQHEYAYASAYEEF